MYKATTQVREITGNSAIGSYLRFGKSQHGEVHYRFIALYGNYITNYNGDIFTQIDDTFSYADPAVCKDIIAKLSEAGYNVFEQRIGAKYEILVEVDQYFYDNDKTVVTLRKKSDSSYNPDKYKRYYKIRKSF